MSDVELLSLRMAAAGYGGGDPRAIRRWPSDVFMDARDFLVFQDQHADTEAAMAERRAKR